MLKRIRRIHDRLLFNDMGPVISTGLKRLIGPEDLPGLPPRLDPRGGEPDLSAVPVSTPVRFLVGIMRVMRRDFALVLGLGLLTLAFELASPLLVRRLLATISETVRGEGYFLLAAGSAVALCFVNLAAAISRQHLFDQMLQSEQRVVNGLNVRIYRHALRLTRNAKSATPVGDLVNHMSTDADSISQLPIVVPEFLTNIVTLVAVVGLLVWLLGPAGLVAVAVLVVLLPVTRYVARRVVALDETIMARRDERVSLMSQVVSGIRIVKYFAWEPRFKLEIEALRSQELSARRRLLATESFSLLFYAGTTTIMAVASFGTYLALGGTLDASLVFSCIFLFQLLQNPFGGLPELITQLAAARVAAGRLNKFLTKETYVAGDRTATHGPGRVSVELESVSVRYPEAAEDALSGLTFSVRPGEKIAVVGPVGCGKSTLLSALLGELEVRGGELRFRGPDGAACKPRTAYAAQEPFIMNASLRRNITFGEAEDGLDAAVEAAALRPDIALLPAGLDTEIGEHGVNLSGGQRQRVSLARAVVRHPDLVLLDDPLSAVDESTEDLLVDRLLFGAFAATTLVMTTHRLRSLRRFDRILFLEQGRLVDLGTFDELEARCGRFQDFLIENERRSGASQPVKAGAAEGAGAPGAAVSGAGVSGAGVSGAGVSGASVPGAGVSGAGGSGRAGGTGGDGTGAPSDADGASSSGAAPGSTPASGRITEDEDREGGAVPARVYLEYFRALGGRRRRAAGWILFLLVATTLAMPAMNILENAWLARWMNALSSAASSLRLPGLGSVIGDRNWGGLTVYAVIGLSSVVLIFGQHLFWAFRAIAAGRDIHDAALSGVLGTRIRFFDATPVGRILNRFSRDVDAVERELAWSIASAVRSILWTLGSLVVILAVIPAAIFVIIPALVLYYRVQKQYRSTARETKRLHSITRSPRFAHFKETLQGLTVVRAFGKQQLFLDEFYRTLAENQRMFYVMCRANRWFSIRVPLLSGVIVLGVVLGIAWAARGGLMQAGTAGLVLTYTLSFWGQLNWSIRAFSQAESSLTSLERLLRYTRLEREPRLLLENSVSETHRWPMAGDIIFDQVRARYDASLPEVLKGVTFRAPEGASVGIIGRTGSGKSTLFQVLFRLIDVCGGRILIDGHDIRSVPLEILRRSIATIPQDPMLFQGTLRRNLDRFGVYGDEEIWEALSRIGLGSFVAGLPGRLEAPVQENGHNFSQGQRQLFCLARALLTRARIIVLDEATASVDVETDSLIQRAIRLECRGITRLIIAHRTETLAECDKIIELAAGVVVREFTPERAPELIAALDRDAAVAPPPAPAPLQERPFHDSSGEFERPVPVS